MYSQIWLITGKEYRSESAKGRDTEGRVQKGTKYGASGPLPPVESLCYPLLTTLCDSKLRGLPSREAHSSFWCPELLLVLSLRLPMWLTFHLQPLLEVRLIPLVSCPSIFFFLTALLEYNCFTMVC